MLCLKGENNVNFNLPNAPTDNLYKFMAIFGLLFAVTTFIYADYMQNETRKQLIEFANDSAQKRYEMVQDYLKSQQGINPELKNKHTLITELLDTKGEYLVAQAMRSDFYIKLRNIGGTTGSIISILGFYLWYTKLQRYQDKVLKKEAGKA